MIVKCICWGRRPTMILTTAAVLATSLRLHLSSWYLYIAAFFMASNWDLFSASLGALSLAHCWLFQSSSRLQQTKKCNAPCVPRQKSAKLKLHASVAGACQWPTYLHDQLHQKSPKTLVENQAKLAYFTVFENHRKSLIQHCERSELRLLFEWTKVN